MLLGKLKYSKFYLVFSIVFLFSVSCKKKKVVIISDEAEQKDHVNSKDETNKKVQFKEGYNGENQPIPSPLGPLQKKKPVCKAPEIKWPKTDKNLPDVSNILPSTAKSLKVMTNARVYQAPDGNSKIVGKLKKYSRLPLTTYAPAGNGCKKYWLNIGKQMYVCGKNLQSDRRTTLLKTQPIIPRGRIVPYKYGRIKSSDAHFFSNLGNLENDKSAGKYHRGDMVQLKEFKSLKGKPYWITGKNYRVWDSSLNGYKVPRYKGINLRKLNINLPAAVIRAKSKGAAVYEFPGGPIKKSVKPLKHYSVRAIYDKKKIGRAKYYRVKEGWILARRVLSAWPSKAPPGIKPCEKWIEINISMQTMVAYEGEEPVYMSPISSGKKRHPTKYGIFRIHAKKAESDMTSSMGASDRYRVDSVPWAMFFYLGQALHGAYWHTNFGNRKSHGCINMTPIDSRWFFDWSEPSLPKGFTELWVDETTPVAGTLVVVKHKYEHQVPYTKYARKLAPPEEVKRLDEIKRKHLENLTKKLYEKK